MNKGNGVLICLFFCLSQILFGQDSENQKDTLLFPSDFFEKEEPANFTLKFNIKEFVSKNDSTKDFPTTLTYYTNDSVEINHNVFIKARGISRQRFCDFPPFFLKLNNSEISTNNLKSKKAKVVTLCKNVSGYNHYLYKEYLIYKLYNLFTDNSFRVRLVNVTFIDEGRKNKRTERLLFVIEPEKLLAERINAVPIKRDELNYRHVEPSSADIMCMFQFMIGNTDFTVNGRHNVKLLKSKDFTQTKLIAVPYDFDFAGIINAEYANPAELLSIDNVADRYYLGICRSDEEFLQTINIFKEKKQEVYDIIDSFEYLPKREIRYTLNYIDEFYRLLEKSNFIEKQLRRTCRK